MNISFLLYIVVIVSVISGNSILGATTTTTKTSKLKYTTKASLKKKKLNVFYMLKMFFVSMVDPEVGKTDALGRSTMDTLGGKKKSSNSKSAGNQYGLGFSNPSSGGASFGAVCGPNGCA